jgi:heme A synthase
MNLDFVRASYWLGAFANIGAAVRLLTPTSGKALGFTGLRAPGASGQPAIVAATLSIGFAVVLVWAHLRTRERRSVLTIALLVALALAAGNIALGLTGAIAWTQLAPTLAIQAVLVVLFALSARIARAAALEREAAAGDATGGGRGGDAGGGPAGAAPDGAPGTAPSGAAS